MWIFSFLIFNFDYYFLFLICQYQNLNYHFQMLCHFLKYQIINLTIKISSVCCCEQNSSLLFYLILQENMNLCQKSFFEYNTDYFIKILSLLLSSIKLYLVCHAIKQDYFFQNFASLFLFHLNWTLFIFFNILVLKILSRFV